MGRGARRYGVVACYRTGNGKRAGLIPAPKRCLLWRPRAGRAIAVQAEGLQRQPGDTRQVAGSNSYVLLTLVALMGAVRGLAGNR
jgi:hypothetical protein